MKTNEKRWIILLVAIAIIAIILMIVVKNSKGEEENNNANAQNQMQNVLDSEKYATELSDGTKVNTSEEFKNTKTYNGLEISNIHFTQKNGVTVLLADVKNTKSTKHEVEIVKITILGENGEVITQINPIIDEIEPGETVQLNASVTANVANAKDFKIEAKN